MVYLSSLLFLIFFFFFLMIRLPPRSTLFPTRRSSDLDHAIRGIAARRSHATLRSLSPTNRSSRSEEHTSNSSHRTISYAVFCLKKKKKKKKKKEHKHKKNNTTHRNQVTVRAKAHTH